MKELKEGAIERIRAVVLTYKHTKNMSLEEKLIIKEYETTLKLLNDGYLAHSFYKVIKCVFAVLVGFGVSVLLHYVFGVI